MSARVVSLRELVLRDVADSAMRFFRLLCVARLLRDESVSATDMIAAIADIEAHDGGEHHLAGACVRALRALAENTEGADHAAVEELAAHCGLTVETWMKETCREQGVVLAQVAA